MKLILSFLLLASSFSVYARNKDQKDSLETREDQMVQEKAEAEKEREEERPERNDDADPELDAIDNDLTRDEGIYDE